MEGKRIGPVPIRSREAPVSPAYCASELKRLSARISRSDCGEYAPGYEIFGCAADEGLEERALDAGAVQLFAAQRDRRVDLGGALGWNVTG